jgi:hypothetical protein
MGGRKLSRLCRHLFFLPFILWRGLSFRFKKKEVAMATFRRTKKVIFDCMTSANGDYDPARVIGYGIVALGGLQFLVLTAYDTIIKGAFDGAQFAIGLTGVSAALAAAAAGVRLKVGSEVPHEAAAPVEEVK